MKKIWKSFCGVCLGLACGAGFVACGKEAGPSSIDIDNDGAISSWEQIFVDEDNGICEGIEDSSVLIQETIEYISTPQQFLDINNKVEESKTYVLTNDIDLGGQEVCINLGLSNFYGQGNMIYNFKLGSANTDKFISNYAEDIKTQVNCLFYNGLTVNGVLIYLGSQKLELADNENIHYSVSPIFNTIAVESISVRGQIEVVANTSSRSRSILECSLLYSGMPYTKTSNEIIIKENNVAKIKNVVLDGRIVLDHKKESKITTIAGSVATTLTEGSSINNAYSNVHIDATISDAINIMDNAGTGNLGGLVGINNGFICNSQATGYINVDNRYSTEGLEYIGSLVGVNAHLAEVKNCVTNVNLNIANAEMEDSLNSGDCMYVVGGSVGYNYGGILEVVQSDAVIKASNINNIIAGGLCGKTYNGVLSYIISRGSIDIENVRYKIDVAQISGASYKGFIDRVIAATHINVDIHTTEQTTLSVGMGVVFENIVESNGLSGKDLIENSPYFRKVLIGGTTAVGIKKDKWPNVNYKLGLRNEFRVLKNEDQDEPEDGYTEDDFMSCVPYIFEDIYYSNEIGNLECVLVVNEYVTGVDGAEAIEKFNPVVDYASDDRNNKLILKGTLTNGWFIHYMDFKGYLNHQEVSLTGKIELNKLHFTYSDEAGAESYFGKASYHGELAHFDYAIDEFVAHNATSYGGCDYDTTDEFFSLIYYMIEKERDKTSGATNKAQLYTIKFDQKCFEIEGSGADLEESIFAGMTQSTYALVENIQKVIRCMGVNAPTIGKYTKTFEDMLSEEFNSEDGIKYVEISFQDETMKYTMTLDVSELQEVQTPASQLVYINFVANKINK